MEQTDYLSLSEQTLIELASKGEADAQAALGLNYYYGTYGTANFEKAYDWMSKAFNRGNHSVAGILGEIFYYNQCKVQDVKEEDYYKFAHILYTDAKENSYISGWRGLAKMLLVGDYLDQNVGLAREYLEQVAPNDAESKDILDHIDDFLNHKYKIRSTSSFNNAPQESPQTPDTEGFRLPESGTSAPGNSDDSAMQDGTEDDERDETFWYDYDRSEEDNLRRWFSHNRPQDHGFEYDWGYDDFKDDLDCEIDIDSDSMTFYEFFAGNNIQDLLIDVMKSGSEATEMLIELSKWYKGMNCEAGMNVPKSIYWAYKAWILSENFYDDDGLEHQVEALEEIADGYFLPYYYYGEIWPKADKAAKFYSMAADHPYGTTKDNVMAARADFAAHYEDNYFYTSPDCRRHLEKAGAKGKAWEGQFEYIHSCRGENRRGCVSAALKLWDEAMQDPECGWGHYFAGRYWWKQQYYDKAITLWKEGERRGCIECSAELFNWIMGHPESSMESLEEQMKKSHELIRSGCVGIYKYVAKYIRSGRINIEKIDADINLGTVWHANNNIYHGTYRKCPYCAKMSSDKSNDEFAIAARVWGYDEESY